MKDLNYGLFLDNAKLDISGIKKGNDFISLPFLILQRHFVAFKYV